MSQQLPIEQEYAGQRLGLPAEGPRSVASWGRRVAALFIDWFACLLVTQAVANLTHAGDATVRFLPLLVFLVEATLLTALVGGSFGQLVLRIAVVRLDGRPLTLLASFLRTFLILLIIPPVVFNRDNRGMHDLAVNSITLRR